MSNLAWAKAHRDMSERIADLERQLSATRAELADTKDDYMRRHNDAVDRMMEVIALRAELAEARAILADFVRETDEWNASMEAIIGRRPRHCRHGAPGARRWREGEGDWRWSMKDPRATPTAYPGHPTSPGDLIILLNWQAAEARIVDLERQLSATRAELAEALAALDAVQAIAARSIEAGAPGIKPPIRDAIARNIAMRLRAALAPVIESASEGERNG